MDKSCFPVRFFSVCFLFIIGEMGFADYWEYSKSYYQDPNIWSAPLRGLASAPEQYRIAVIWLAYFFARHGHIGMRHALTLIDVVSAIVSVFVLFFVARIFFNKHQFSQSAQLLGAAFFAGLIQYYFLWVTSYQRPETLASTLMVSATFLLLCWRPPFPNQISGMFAVLIMIAIAILQGFIRADVAFVLHAGILLVCLSPLGNGFILPRRTQLATSLVSLLASGGIQYYLMHVVYPHATYGSTPVVEFWLNFGPRRLLPFALFVFPFVWTIVFAIRGRHKIGAAPAALLTASVLYLGMWFAVGKIDEERIFLPFAFALAPVTVFLAANLLSEGAVTSTATIR